MNQIGKKIKTHWAPQNHLLNLSFVKYIHTTSKTMARNGPTKATLFSVSFRICLYLKKIFFYYFNWVNVSLVMYLEFYLMHHQVRFITLRYFLEENLLLCKFRGVSVVPHINILRLDQFSCISGSYLILNHLMVIFFYNVRTYWEAHKISKYFFG